MQEMGPAGWVTVPMVNSGTWGMGSILDCLLPSQVSSVQGVIVINSDGTPEDGPGDELQPADWTTPSSDFADTSQVPVVGVDGSSVQYDRPYRGSGDLDYDDHLTEAAPLEIEAFEGPLLTVTPEVLAGPLLSSSQTTVTKGTRVSLSASVTGNDDSNLNYDWSFDGATDNSSQPSPQVTFNIPGVYSITVQVTDAAGGGGAATLTLTVNPAAGAPRPAKGHKHQKGYGSKGSKNGAATGPVKSHGHGRDTSGGLSTGSGTGAIQQSGAVATTATPTRPSPAVTASTHAHVPPSAKRRPRRGRPTGRRSARAVVPATGIRVSGRLIGDVVTQTATVSQLVHIAPAAPGAPSAIRRAISASTAMPVSGGALAALALLALGIGWERRSPRWRQEPPGAQVGQTATRSPDQASP